MEWEWHGMQWNGMEWNGKEWNNPGGMDISMRYAAHQQPPQRIK